MIKANNIIFLVFVLFIYSKGLDSLNSKIKLPEFNQIDFKAEEGKLSENDFLINIKYEDNQEVINIGKKGTLYFKTDCNDNGTNIFDSSEIEEKTAFQTFFTEQKTGNNYNITCRLWKPNHGNLRLFCKLEENLSDGEHIIKINNCTFNYGKYNILINFQLDWTKVYQFDYLPFLYSDEQIINIDDEKDIYYLKLNIETYNKEILFIGGKFLNRKILNNCKINEKELICEMKKEDLIGILPMNGGNLFLYYYIPKHDEIKQYSNVLNITVNIKNLQKEDIYVGITKLIYDDFMEDNFVPFETNITNIPNLITEAGQYIVEEEEEEYTCYLRKDPDKPLLLLCTGFSEDAYPLKDLINKEILFNNINAKYNFRIQPTNNTEEFDIDGHGSYIYFVYPNILDFTKKNEYKINFVFGKKKYNYEKLKLRPDLIDLQCDSTINGFSCIINSEYFENNKNGYYNLYHFNSLADYIILYEVPPFEVILPKAKTLNIKTKIKQDEDLVKIGEKGILYFKTNYDDEERNIFNNSDIEEKTKFETLIYDNDSSSNIECTLWKPNNNIIIKCKLNSYDFSSKDLQLETVSLNYNEYVINIFFEGKPQIIKRSYEIPFLYSDSQTVDIKDNIDSYNFEFKIGIYNNELLYLYGEVNNSLILDKCEKNGKILKCRIERRKLLEILVKKNEQFRVKALHDDDGLIELIGVSNITINHKINKKEDIYIGIVGTLTEQIDVGVPFGFKTNVTDIPNIYSDTFSDKIDNCYFKKLNDNPLLFLCRLDRNPKKTLNYGNITNEIILNNLHYKYNFRIQPFKETYNFEVDDESKDIKLFLPEVLNFTSEDILTITLITTKSSYIYNLWINPDSETPLECQNIKEVKKCIVSISHFLKKKSGDFYLYYSDSSRYYDLSPIKVIIPNSIVEITVEHEDNDDYIYMGDKGLFSFKTNYNDTEKNIFDASDIEEKTAFSTTFDGYIEIISVPNIIINCRLWKPLNEKLWLFCKLDKSLEKQTNYLFVHNATFHYKEHIIAIQFNTDFRLKLLDISVPVLYIDKQIINITEEIDSYDLQIHVGLYNEEPLYLFLEDLKIILLQDCQEKEEDLICNIKKEKFYEIFTNSGQKLKLYPYDYLLKNIEFKSAYDIIINFDNIQKEDVFIKISKLLDKKVDNSSFIAFETNITNISDVFSDKFELDFGDDYDNKTINFTCRIKKSINTNLIIYCLMSKPGRFYLKEIKDEKILDNINIKYNFRIQPVNISEQIISVISGEIIDQIKFVYPMTLNYYLYDSISIVIDYSVNTLYLKGLDIILNPDTEKLNCEPIEYSFQNTMKRCIVPIRHFDGKKEGYYSIFNYGYFGDITTAYQLSPIKVILPKENDIIIRIKKEDNKDVIKIGKKGILFLITNFEDNNNIFNISHISFNSYIKDENNNNYNVNCKLWIPKNDKLRIICKLNENLLNNYQQISLNKVEIAYNNYNIVISQQDFIEVERSNYDISFLYSEQQNIEIKEGIEFYNFKFYIEKYNDEILYIYGEKNNSLILENCKKKENELNCQLSKEKLEEILIKNNEQFRVSAINNNIGIINFDFILNITINYEIEKKEDIYVEIINLLSSYSQEGTPIAFETNVTNIPNINSDIFNLCYFKKYKNTNLLYLCNFNINTKSYIVNDELIINNSHYKYNFRIQPSKNAYHFIVSDYGTNINLVYPEILNFTSEKLLTIKYITPNPSLIENIKLVSDSDYLYCENLIGLKKCSIPLIHLIENKNEYYYLNQLNGERKFIHYESSPINVILPENIIKIYVNDEDNEEKIIIGKNGFFSFVTNYTDEEDIFDISDIEGKIYFHTTISQKNNNELFNVDCRLWKPKNDKLRLLCYLNKDIGINYIKINSAIFSYKKYTIALISKMSFKIQAIKTGKNIPVLYSDRQEINIEENKQFYELKFNIEEYNDEVLFLQRKKTGTNMHSTELILEDCYIKLMNLVCKIEKEKIIENLYYNGEIFQLNYYFYKTLLHKFSCVLDIKINYNIPQKEVVFVGITKLLQNNLDYLNYIPYETNITSISNVITDFFSYNTSIGLYNCMMKKSANKSLLFLCLNEFTETKYSLGENNTEVLLNNIHIKYNFIIQPVNRPEEITMENEGSRILSRYPTKLDFTKNDLIPIYFFMSKPGNTKGIRLNPDSEELDCVYPYENVTKCLVPKNHFNESGYYYTYYLNSENSLNIFYDISPILVNLEEKGDSGTDDSKEDSKTQEEDKNLVGIIVGSVVGGLVLIGIISFFVVRYYRRKKASIDDFSGKNENILSNSIKELEN